MFPNILLTEWFLASIMRQIVVEEEGEGGGMGVSRVGDPLSSECEDENLA